MKNLENQLFKLKNIKLNVPSEIDENVYKMIYRENSSHFSFKYLISGVAIAGIILVISMNVLTKKTSPDPFNYFTQKLRNALSSKNPDELKTLFASNYFDEKGISKEEFVREVEDIFKTFKRVEYSSVNEEKIIKGKKALLKNISEVVLYKKNQKIRLKAIEKVYMVYTGGEWKVDEWICETIRKEVN